MTEPKDLDAARARLRSVSEETARRRHPGYEPTDPPPSPHGGDALPPYRARQPTWDDRLAPPGRVMSHLQKIVVGIVGVCAALGTMGAGVWHGFIWAVDHAVDARFEAFQKRLDPGVLLPTKEEKALLIEKGKPLPLTIDEHFEAQKVAIEKLQASLDAPNNPHAQLGRQLDALDKAIQRTFPPRPTRMPLPAVGPTAKAEGRP